MNDKDILLVEDNPDDAALTLRAFKRSHVMNSIHLVRDGIEALENYAGEIGLSIQTGLLYSVYEDTKTGRQHVVYRATLGAGAPKTGKLFPVQDLPVFGIADNAVRELVKRYAAESTLGNFGVYFGNQDKGRVHAVAAKG